MKLQANLAKSTSAWSRTAGPIWTSFSQSSHCLTDHSVAWSSPDPAQCHSSYSPSSPTERTSSRRWVKEEKDAGQSLPPPSERKLHYNPVCSPLSSFIIGSGQNARFIVIKSCSSITHDSWHIAGDKDV